MSAAQHTPGSWSVDGCTVYVLNGDALACNRFSAHVQPGFIQARARTSDAECEANARLIAAAPDLLEESHMNLAILTALLSKFNGVVSDQVCAAIRERISATVAVINKATGEAA